MHCRPLAVLPLALAIAAFPSYPLHLPASHTPPAAMRPPQARGLALICALLACGQLWGGLPGAAAQPEGAGDARTAGSADGGSPDEAAGFLTPEEAAALLPVGRARESREQAAGREQGRRRRRPPPCRRHASALPGSTECAQRQLAHYSPCSCPLLTGPGRRNWRDYPGRERPAVRPGRGPGRCAERRRTLAVAARLPPSSSSHALLRSSHPTLLCSCLPDLA